MFLATCWLVLLAAFCMAFRVTFLVVFWMAFSAVFVEEAGLMVNLGARLVALVTVLLAFL